MDDIDLSRPRLAALMRDWTQLDVGSEELGRRLLGCWTQPHRVYHGIGHLQMGLNVVALLGGGGLISLAIWFHDAVWTLPSDPDHARDEARSADLACDWLDGLLEDDEIEEVARLVLLTASHDPGPWDASGARASDADLAALSTDWEHYEKTVAGLRAEAGLDGPAWAAVRRPQIDELLGRRRIYHWVESWERDARDNLARERELLG